MSIHSMVVNNKEQFLSCLDKTVAWCNGKDNDSEPRACLRSTAMNSVFKQYDQDVNAAWLSSELIYDVLKKRDIISNLPNEKESGRVLLIAYEHTNHNGLTESETNGYFDDNDNPPWDTWICEIEIKYPIKPIQVSFMRRFFSPKKLKENYDKEECIDRLLVAWVPDCFIEIVQDAIAVECCNMLFWADTEYPELDYKKGIPKWFQNLYQNHS